MERPTGWEITLLGTGCAATIAGLAILAGFDKTGTTGAYLAMAMLIVGAVIIGAVVWILYVQKGLLPRVVMVVVGDPRGDGKREFLLVWDIYNKSGREASSLRLELRVRLLRNGNAIQLNEWSDCYEDCERADPSFRVLRPHRERDYFLFAAVLNAGQDMILPEGHLTPMRLYWHADKLQAKVRELGGAAPAGTSNIVWSFEWRLGAAGMSSRKGCWEAVLCDPKVSGNWMKCLETDGASSAVDCRNRKHVKVESCDLCPAAADR